MREARVQAVSLLMGTRFDWAHSLHEIGRVLPKDASVSSVTGTVGASTASASASAKPAATGTTGSASAVASATPPGTVPTLTINGCATSQGEVALVLQRLRLMDGVSEVKLASSAKTNSGGSTSSSAGGCAPNDPAFIVNVSFDGLPTPAATAPSTTLAANEGSGTSATGGVR